MRDPIAAAAAAASWPRGRAAEREQPLLHRHPHAGGCQRVIHILEEISNSSPPPKESFRFCRTPRGGTLPRGGGGQESQSPGSSPSPSVVVVTIATKPARTAHCAFQCANNVHRALCVCVCVSRGVCVCAGSLFERGGVVVGGGRAK